MKECFILYSFNAINHNPISMTNLSHLPPRTEISYFSQVGKNLPNIAYLSRLSIVIVGEPELQDECRKSSIVTKNVVCIFYYLFPFRLSSNY